MNLRQIEHTRTGKAIDINDGRWAARTKQKMADLIATYKGKKFTTTHLVSLQSEVNTLLRSETGLRTMEVEAEVMSQGKIIFNYCNEATKKILKRVYVDESKVSTATSDMEDRHGK